MLRRLALIALIAVAFPACGDALGQSSGSGRSDKLREQVDQQSPLKLVDYRAAEAARAKEVDARLTRIESELQEISRALRAIEARLPAR